MENIIQWLQLSLTLGGTAAGGLLLRRFGTAEKILSQNVNLLLQAGELNEAAAEKLRNVKSAEPAANEIAAVCRNFGWQILTPESRFYPQNFRRLPEPPFVVYAMGDLSVLLAPDKAAVVGTRHPHPTPLVAAYDLGAALSDCGIVTVSGGALGIDSAAHEGALTSFGSTVCVLGCGFGDGYLGEKVFMRRRIAQQGVLLTEMVPFERASTQSFPRRNRLIAALGDTLTVMQSNVRGGSMVSAQYAARYGKPMYALSPQVYASEGCEKLIAEGAVALENTGTLTSFYGVQAESWSLRNTGANVPPVLTPAECTLQEFARLNRVSSAEARPLWESLRARSELAPHRAVRQIRSLPRQGTAPPPKAPEAPPPEPLSLKEKIAAAQDLSGNMKTVFMALEPKPEDLDTLSERTGIAPGELMAAITLLELSDLAETHPGNRVSLKTD